VQSLSSIQAGVKQVWLGTSQSVPPGQVLSSMHRTQVASVLPLAPRQMTSGLAQVADVPQTHV
jgi:hypothetical protein